MAMDGLIDVFPRLRRGRRQHVVVRVGEPIGPFSAPGRGRQRRARLEEIGHEIMKSIADLLPVERRGYYSDDPDVRAAAAGLDFFPWDEEPEG